MPTPTPSPRRWDLLSLSFLSLFGAVLCQGVLRGEHGLGPETYLDGDVVFGTAPTTRRAFDDLTPIVLETPRDRHIVERARAGHLDLWNPLQGTGVPLAPDQGGLFSPLRLVHVLIPGQTGYVLFHVIRLWIAAAGTFLFARRLGLTRLGALLAAVVFGYGGGMISQVSFVSGGPVCFLPWILLATEALRERPSAMGRVLVGLAVAGAITAGHPTVATSVLIGGVAYGLAGVAAARGRGAQGVEGGRRRALLDLAAGWAFGLAFAAPFLLAFAEYVANGYSYKQAAIGAGEHGLWRDFTRASVGAAVAFPAVLDGLRDVEPERAYPYVAHFVAGTAAWVLAGVALVRRGPWGRAREGRGGEGGAGAGGLPVGLFVLAAVGIVLSLEPPPFDELVPRLPMLKHVLPRYYWPLVMVPVACAAGAGADAIAGVERERTWGELRGAAAAAVGFAGLALAALGVATFNGGRFASTWAKLVAGLPEPGSARGVEHHLAVIAGVAVVAATARFGWRHRGAALLFVAAAEMVGLMRPHLREKRAEALRRPVPEAAARLAEATATTHTRMTGPSRGVAMTPLPSIAGIPDVRMTAPLVPARYDAFLRAAGAGDSFTYFYLPHVKSPWADLAAVRFLVTETKNAGADPALHAVGTLPLSVVLERPSALGRARLFFGAATAKSQEDATAQLRALARGGEHIEATGLRDRVIVEAAGTVAPAPLAGKGSAEVRWILDDADQVIVESDGAAPGYVMLADTYYPGWKATVDGASSPIFPADVGFRAVAVPAGKHVVRFYYRPASVAYGLAILATAAVAAWLFVRRERERSRAG